MLIAKIVSEFFAALVVLVLFAGVYTTYEKSQKKNCLMIILMANNLMLLLDVVTWILEYNNMVDFLYVIFTISSVSLLYTSIAAFNYYIYFYLAEKCSISVWFGRIGIPVCLFGILMWLTSPIHGQVFYIEDGVYIHGPLYLHSQIVGASILVYDLILAVIYFRKLELSDFIGIISFMIFPMTATVITMKYPMFGSLLIYLSVTLGILMVYTFMHVQQSIELKRKENALTQERLSIMMSQIQPHFLYNSLNSIYYLCTKDPEMAQKAIGEFSDYLRGNLDSLRTKEPVPFEKELDHIQNYLALEKMRFDDDLTIVYDIQVKNFKLPALSVQPIVENAVKYGVCKSPDGGTVTISTREYDDRYEIIVDDDGVGGYTEAKREYDGRSHIGIQNVRERLKLQCQGTLDIVSVPGEGTTVTITIPKER
ncbi:sensor histidine kinase [Oribacterium sp. WCC10]|uniref:sensor histidine kinase n=1 Tax=Oribacterium sp. WCC10 TaxID=1855343 RepID=UPI0008E893D2|nr:histidine kinase [Oribacterium sp. WCC10]SFG19053.1 Histidine kinase-, DNA gyrase B-, and HSP90-like ATPase [Oribacterium sp. WCC10]